MAKTTSKRTPAKLVAVPKSKDLVETTVLTIEKLKSLGVDPQLQQDLEWCLGSYRHDHNTLGLHRHLHRAIDVLTEQLNRKTKGITSKFIADLKKDLI